MLEYPLSRVGRSHIRDVQFELKHPEGPEDKLKGKSKSRLYHMVLAAK